MPGVEDHREARTLAHYEEARAAGQCTARHLWVNWPSLANILVHKDLLGHSREELKFDGDICPLLASTRHSSGFTRES
jgi:hypothetical protein